MRAHKKLLLTYMISADGDKQMAIDLILADIYMFEKQEEYEICGELKKVLKLLE